MDVHKDYGVIASNAAYELNKILSILPDHDQSQISNITMTLALINNTTVNIGTMRPMLNHDRDSLLYVYEQRIHFWDIKTGNLEKDMKNLLDLLAYLQGPVCENGRFIQELTTKSRHCGISKILQVLPNLPKKGEKSREVTAQFTPPKKQKRIRFVTTGFEDVLLIPSIDC